MEKKPVSLDDVLDKFSVFGCYHARLLFLLFLTLLTNGMFSYNYVFAVEATEYRCKNSINLCEIQPHRSSTEEQITEIEPRCYERVALDNGISCTYDNNSKLVPCTEWEYDSPHSFVAEMQIACQDWKRTLIGTAHSIGYMVGLLLVGPISDRLGRKPVLVTTAFLGGVVGVSRSFLTNYWLYVIFEFFESIIGDPCSPAFMLVVEMVTSKDRPLFLMLAGLGYCFGHVVLVAIAWYVQYWRNFLQALYAPALLFILYTFWIDESPRWLLANGRKQEAIDILIKAAKINGVTLDKDLLENLSYEESTEKDTGYVTLLRNTFKSKVILKRFLVCVTWWTAGSFLTYGVTVNAVFLNGNIYVNMILMHLIEIPTNLMLACLLKCFNRKMPLIFSFLAAAIIFLVHAFIPVEHRWLSLVCYLGGKVMVMLLFSIVYVFTSELFPTGTRNSMHALCSSIGRIGSALSQQTPLLLVYWNGLPSSLFAGMALVGGLVTFLVPDTDGDLPDTLQQAEAIGRQTEAIGCQTEEQCKSKL